MAMSEVCDITNTIGLQVMTMAAFQQPVSATRILGGIGCFRSLVYTRNVLYVGRALTKCRTALQIQLCRPYNICW